MLAKIEPTASFKDNLAQLPAIDGVQSLVIRAPDGTVVATIENAPGKQGSLAVYQYLHLCAGRLDADAAQHGLAIFGEHTPDARSRPGAHPNIDRLLEIVAGGPALSVEVVPAAG